MWFWDHEMNKKNKNKRQKWFYNQSWSIFISARWKRKLLRNLWGDLRLLGTFEDGHLWLWQEWEVDGLQDYFCRCIKFVLLVFNWNIDLFPFRLKFMIHHGKCLARRKMRNQKLLLEISKVFWWIFHQCTETRLGWYLIKF